MPITIDGSGTITGAATLATTVASPTFTTPNINSAQFATVSGTAPIYPCRAWVNFNGTGTVAIRASGNVSSITDNGAGDYTVNLTTAMPDANYSFSALCGYNTGVSESTFVTINTTVVPTTSAYRFKTRDTAGNIFDSTYVLSSVFR
jgi:hypothetical protein